VIVIIGLVVLMAAVGVGVAAVLSNYGSDQARGNVKQAGAKVKDASGH
jgi:hypothetical protein